MDHDIPALAYIEQQVLGHAVAKGSLRRHARKIEIEYGLRHGALGSGLFWKTRLLSLLYTLILFPMEYWKMNEGDPIYREVADRWSADCVRVSIPDEKYEYTVYGFIRRLRNALAHANISFHGDDIEIWDIWEGREVYRARISKDEAERFLETVGSIMANRRNWAVS